MTGYLKSFGIEVGKGKHHEEAIYSVALLYNLLSSEIERYLQKFGLSAGKLNVLVTIRNRGGEEGISQVDISKNLIVSPANMTKLLDKLEKEGLVTRGAQEGDRRVNIIRITPKGEKLLDQLWPGYLKTLEELGKKLSQKDQKQLASSLMGWVGKLSA